MKDWAPLLALLVSTARAKSGAMVLRFFLLCFLGIGSPLLGAPASPEWFSISQGGQDFEVRQRGDEFFSWYETSEGFAVAMNISGDWELQRERPDGMLGFEGTGNILVNGLDANSYDTSPFFTKDLWAEIKFQRWISQKELPTDGIGSTYRLLVILAYFSDHTSSGNLEESYVSGNVSGTDYQDLLEGTSGVLHEYFNRESGQSLSIDAHVTSWLALGQPEESYLTSSENLVSDAMSALETAGNTSGVSVDGSLSYDGVMIIHSGKDQARSFTGVGNLVWSGSGNLNDENSILSGAISIKDYAVVAALGGNDETSTTDVGVLCHEMAHLLGLTDIQEYDAGGFGGGAWDLMGSGAWGFSGNISGAAEPSPLGAWSRLRKGWATATDLTVTGSNLSLASVQDSGSILRLSSENPNEYFLIENRSPQEESWASAPMGNAGLLIWHIDESGIKGSEKEDWAHPLAKIEEADANDTLGTGNTTYEEGDLWSFQSVLTSFLGGAGNTGFSSLYEDGFYYQRPTGANLSYYRLENFREDASGVLFDFSGTNTQLSIKDFANAEIQWLEIEGATGYDLQRRIGVTVARQTLLVNQNQLNYTDTVSGSETYQYRVRAGRYDDDAHWSSILNLGLQLESASFEPHSGVLDLDWNLPVELAGSEKLNLYGVRVVNSTGSHLFTLEGNTDTFSYPVLKGGDSVKATVLTGTSISESISIQLSDAQRYEWIVNSSVANSDLFIELDAGSAITEIASGNLENSDQTVTLNSAISVSSQQDTTPPSVQETTYADDSGQINVYYDEPLLITSLPAGSLFSLRGANGLTTSLDDAEVSYHGNLLSLSLSGRDRIRAILIQSQNGGDLIVDLPGSQIKDISSVAHGAVSWSDVSETPDAFAPSISSFVLDNRDESRYIEITFSEPVFFPGDITPSADDFGAVICSSNGQFLPLGGNTIGSELETVSLTQSAADSFGGATIPPQTTSVRFELSEAEVDAFDVFNDDLNRVGSRVFTNPAPEIFARFSKDGGFTDYNRYLQSGFVCNQSAVTSSKNYTPRRRARFLHPHYSASVTDKPGTQESLVWKWKHRLAYEINGGWSGGESIQIDWGNPNLSANVLTEKILGAGLSLSPDENQPFQYLIWDTRQDEDALGYTLKIYRLEDGTGDKLLLDASQEVEVDNTSPQVTISYISQSNPSHKVNATDVFSEAPELYQGSFPLSSDEADNSNVLIVATYTEPVVEAPYLDIDQPGLIDVSNAIMSSSDGNLLNTGGGNTSSIFYYAYDVQPQDAGDYSDGTARVTLTSVQDRAVGHLVVDSSLTSTSTEIEGNRALTAFERLDFSIDTIPPTVSSLEFVILDESIIAEFSSLGLTYSEDLYRPVGGFDATPLGSEGDPVTGIFSEENYVITGSGADGLRVDRVDRTESGQGPYKIFLNGIVAQGILKLSIFPGSVKDLHNNVLGEPSEVTAIWPGPLRNRSEVFLPIRGRTRLLMSGGFPPYSLAVNDVYSGIAGLDSQRPLDILGLGLGSLTVEVTESRNQTRYVNVDVINPYPASISDYFQAYRDELDYRMVGFPFNLPTWNGKGLMTVLQSDIGTMGEDYVLYTYDEEGEYQSVGVDTIAVGPGFGFWMASRKARNITVEGEGSWPLQVVGVDLHGGWNLIGNPFDETLDIDQIFVSADGVRSTIDDLSQSQTANEIWSIDIFTPQYQTLQALEPFQGAWLYVNNPEGAELVFFRGQEQAEYPIDYEVVSQSKPRESQAPYPPSRPGSFSASGVGSSSGGGGGGCLLR